MGEVGFWSPADGSGNASPGWGALDEVTGMAFRAGEGELLTAGRGGTIAVWNR